MSVLVLPHHPLWHLGALHPVEQGLTLILAFGPFLVLGLVVWLRRREDTPDDEPAAPDADDGLSSL